MRALGKTVFSKSEKLGVQGRALQVSILVVSENNYSSQILERTSTFGEKCFSTLASYFSGARTTWEIMSLFLPLAHFHPLQSVGDYHSIETTSGMISVL